MIFNKPRVTALPFYVQVERTVLCGLRVSQNPVTRDIFLLTRLTIINDNSLRPVPAPWLHYISLRRVCRYHCEWTQTDEFTSSINVVRYCGRGSRQRFEHFDSRTFRKTFFIRINKYLLWILVEQKLWFWGLKKNKVCRTVHVTCMTFEIGAYRLTCP